MLLQTKAGPACWQPTPHGKCSNKLTKHDWNAYLVKLRVEVDAGEAPVELYLHRLEILSEQKVIDWFCI